MNVNVRVESASFDQAVARLRQLGAEPRQLLEAVGQVLKTRIQLGFVNGTDPYGKPWAPLKSRAGQPLRDRGNLMSSFDYQVTGNRVEIGTNLSYAAVHQYGATIRPRDGNPKSRLRFRVGNAWVFAREVTIPPREMLPLNGLPSDWEEDIAAAGTDVISRIWKG